MKKRSFLMTTLCALMMSMGWVSCDNEEYGPLDIPAPETSIHATFILNEGLWGANNAGIAAHFVTTIDGKENQKFIGNYYEQANSKKMGDLANAMMKEDDKIYVILGGSKYVAKLDLYCNEEGRYAFPEGEGEPRCIDVEDDYAYVTQHGGKVSKLNTKDMTLAGTFEGGDNLEGIVEKDGKLYVANAWKIDGSNNYIYNKEIWVIDAKTMTQTGTISVVDNPVNMYEINDKIYVISQGNYYDIQAALQVIDVKAGTSKFIANDVDKITEGHNGLIYGVKSTYDENWNTINSFFTYNPKDGTVNETSFLQDAPSALSSTAIYLLEVDEGNGFIYVGTSDYVNSGTIYQFDQTGKFLRQFDSGGVNPSAMIFID